ncbi:flagellar biosynthesis anti-sigma factor FlgM [Geothrix oryzisoli]|uniref:flagellar biosynthesis anti-sigma factor FlgM n=1 Tax=Geothrix oryzisoli TaxID=2922721 RepID=UPI001FAD3CAB|nr:flagellar biosynthesis anti-sigma factor FlgM [Geothrix oryzisoli]
MSGSGKSHRGGGPRKAEEAKESAADHLVAVAHEVLAETPDVRTEKLRALKRQLEAGTYHPDEGAVAEGVIREYLSKTDRQDDQG